MNSIDICGTVGAICSAVAFAPQIYKTYQAKSANDVSLLTLINYLIGAIAWFAYGIFNNLYFIIFSNIFSITCASIIIIQKKYYNKYYAGKISPNLQSGSTVER